MNAWQKNAGREILDGGRATKVTPSEARRNDLEARTANTSSCVLRACCPVETSSPLQALVQAAGV
ncbi:hypothetical protein [Streptomyces sp. NBC_00893]|uniref:hypothetical protein n=1 Tax=Streptomyces sp. NBC_00893 TaxID=2975862 RepID=UPI002251259B|nr:hypothetical protein [Streptomyces sp. NBC_00893]MCX4850931.1 hypothetical protein [Streptomyces sp. NBC_00893]